MRKTSICVIMFFVVIAGIMWNPPDRADRGMPPSERPVATIQVSLHSSIPKEGAPPEKDVGTPTDNGAAIAAPRAVTVTIMVDKELLADTEKDATILQIVSLMHETSERFSHNFGISFFYTVVPWDYLPGDIEVDIHNALDDVERQWTVQMSDITVAVTKKRSRSCFVFFVIIVFFSFFLFSFFLFFFFVVFFFFAPPPPAPRLPP